MGSQGSKGHFHQKCYFSFRLHGMAMGLIHIDQLDTLYKSYGSRNSPGVTWGHRGQKVIFTKNAISPSDYMVWPSQSAQERRPDGGKRSSPTSVWRWRRRRVLIGRTSIRRREKYVGTTVGRLFAYVINTILDLFPTFCPPALNVAPTVKWRWPDRPNIHLRPIPDLLPARIVLRTDKEMTYTRLFPDLPKTYSRPITYPHKTSPRQRNDVGPTSVRSWHGFERFLATFQKR